MPSLPAPRWSLPASVLLWALLAAGLTAVTLWGRGDLFRTLPFTVPMGVVNAGMALAIRFPCRSMPVRGPAALRLALRLVVPAALFTAVWLAAALGWEQVLSTARAWPDGTGFGPDGVPRLAALGLALFLLAAALHHLLLSVRQARQAEERELRLTVLAREAELRALKAQVHPHFLFNSLTAISALTATDPEAARRMCRDLADFLRETLEVAREDFVTLEREAGLARRYLAVESVRFAGRLSIDISVDEGLGGWPVPALVLQPLVENAVRHGVGGLPEGGRVEIEARREDGELCIRVENPRDPDAPPARRQGLGLRLVDERLWMHYGPAARFEALRLPNRYRVTLRLPRAPSPAGPGGRGEP
ncbi:MAG: histidine kinase [Acidobacteria bacterium]|nr:histidine kinase [Acidobacteriota bacterium]